MRLTSCILHIYNCKWITFQIDPVPVKNCVEQILKYTCMSARIADFIRQMVQKPLDLNKNRTSFLCPVTRQQPHKLLCNKSKLMLRTASTVVRWSILWCASLWTEISAAINKVAHVACSKALTASVNFLRFRLLFMSKLTTDGSRRSSTRCVE